MTAFFLGGEVGSNPIIGGLDACGRLHEVASYAERAQGIAAVVLGPEIAVEDLPSPHVPDSPSLVGRHVVVRTVEPLAAAS